MVTLPRIIMLFLVTTLLLGLPTAAFPVAEVRPSDGQAPELTLEDAVNRAVESAVKVEQAELDVDKAWETRKAARSGYVKYADMTFTGDVYVSMPGVGDPFFQFLSANSGWNISKQQLDLTKDAVALQAKITYFDIIKKQRSLETAQLALEKAQNDYKVARAKALVGMSSNAEIEAAASRLEQSTSALEQAKADLENAYRTLNKMIGYVPETRPVLTTTIEFEKLEVPSVENKVATALSPNNNPYLWIMKENYELTKYTWTYASVEEAAKLDKDKTSLSYDDARKETRNKIYEMYDSLKSLEASYESALQGVKAAEEGLRAVKAMYEVGMVTKSEVLDKEHLLSQAKDGLLEVKRLYAITKETFEKPWLAVESAG